jgi:FG-GAP repeat
VANGDGYEDLIAGVPGEQQARIYLGHPDVLYGVGSPVVLFDLLVPSFGAAVASAGDVDGDRFHDVLVGAPLADRVFLYRGGPGNFDTVPDIDFTGTPGTGFGASVTSGGSMYDSSRDAIVIAAPGDQGGALSIYDGDGQLRAYIGGLGGSGAGVALSEPVDVNSDGYSDVVISAGPNTPVQIVLGGQFETPSLLAVPQNVPDDGFGAAIAP